MNEPAWKEYLSGTKSLKEYIQENPEEYNSDYEHLFTEQEIKDMSMSLRSE